MLSDVDMRQAVASLIEFKLVGTRGFVERTGARGFLHLTSGRSRVGPEALATVGAVSGGLRLTTPDRLVVIERCGTGYRVLVRSLIGGFPLVLYDAVLVDLEGTAPALLDVLPVMRT